MENRLTELRYLYLRNKYGQTISKIISIFSNKIYLPCFEVPITTFCTLRCKNCANLIQYYDKPYHVDEAFIIHDIDKVISSVDKIGCVRILGGEPLLSPALCSILQLLIASKKIDNVSIVTNGTLLFNNDLLNVMKSTNKIKVSISDYNNVSRRIVDLEKQLNDNGIRFETRKVEWREKSVVSPNGLMHRELKDFFKICPNKFFSLLNGKIYICPKSAHAIDLGLIKCSDLTDFVDLRGNLTQSEIRKQIIQLIKKPYVEMCQYCNEYNNEDLKIVISGEQCTKSEAMINMDKMKKEIIGGITNG